MPEIKTIFCRFGLLGDNLELKKNVILTIRNNLIQDIQVDQSNREAQLHYPKCAVVPGFINAHTHIGDSFAKDQGLNLSIQELVEPPYGLKHRLLSEISDEDLKKGLIFAIREMISCGITTFVDFRESGETGIDSLKQVLENHPMNAIICGRPFPDLESFPKVLKKCEALGLSSSNIYSDIDLNYLKNNCKNSQKLILTHASETKEERSFALKKFEKSDIRRALEVLDADILIHITWADEEDIKEIAEQHRAVVICPRSNSHLGVGYPPLLLLNKYKILTCLGSDNVMINNLNLFREMEFLFKSAREKFGINCISSFEILKMVTINPARALKLEQDIGSLNVGKMANFFLIDLNAPNLCPLTSLYDALILRANPLNVKGVFIGGTLIYAQ
ncbi:MAG TPA: amidohydrolase family protein [Candidatus Deferrimicrobium sp.]|nr:amidohydrolase family protein [Candidatus Deferrimicrobium sp.]